MRRSSQRFRVIVDVRLNHFTCENEGRAVDAPSTRRRRIIHSSTFPIGRDHSHLLTINCHTFVLNRYVFFSFSSRHFQKKFYRESVLIEISLESILDTKRVFLYIYIYIISSRSNRIVLRARSNVISSHFARTAIHRRHGYLQPKRATICTDLESTRSF